MYYLSIIQLRVTDTSQFGVIKEALDQISFFVENLFAKDNICYGAYVLDQNSEEIHNIAAKVTVLATGGAGKMDSSD